jgi:hypothetical protein
MIAWIKKFFSNKNDSKKQEPEDVYTAVKPSLDVPKTLDKNERYVCSSQESLRGSINLDDYKPGDVVLDKNGAPIIGKLRENIWQVIDKRDGRVKIIERVWVANLPVYIPKDIPTGKTAKDLYS